MNLDLLPVAILLFLFSAACAGFIAVALRRQRTELTLAFIALVAGVGLWCLFYGVELLSPSLQAKIFWGSLQYLGIATVPLAWLLVALIQSNRGMWLSRRVILLLSVVPGIIILLALTNRFHRLIWMNNALSENGFFMINQYGIAFWLYIAFTYISLATGSIFLLIGLRARLSSMFRWQAILLLLASVLPWIGNAVYITASLNPIPGFDWTPIAFGLAIVSILLSISRFQFLDIVPIARSSIINSLQDGMLVVDLPGRVLDANRAAVGLFGMAQDELVGLSIVELLPDAGILEQVDDQPLITELTLGHRTAEQAYQLRISPIFDHAQQKQGHVLFFNDVTDRKEQEDLREDLLRAMVHDLRAPISNIAGTLQWLSRVSEDKLEDVDHTLLNMSLENARKLLGMISAILEINRLEQNELPLEISQFSLLDLLEQVAADNQMNALNKEIELQVNVENEAMLVEGDINLVGRTVQNLLDNAIKFTPNKGTVSLEGDIKRDKEKQAVVVTVRDSGPGIPLFVQARLFEKFAAGNQPEKGSGLGLAFCKMVVEAHGEKIWVESDKQGTAVSFSLPVFVSKEVVAQLA